MLRHLYLLKNPTFLRFFLGNAISLVGFGFNFIATGWIVLDMTGSKVAVGEMVAVSTLPGLVIALYAGTIIDRMNRKHLLVFLDLYRPLAIIAIPILHWAGQFQLWQLYVMSFLTGTGSSIFWSCASAFTQELVKEKDFMSANSLLSASYQTGALLGSALGGFVIGHTALALDALTYIISAILIASAVHWPAPYLEKQESVWETFKYGFRFLRRRKMIFVYGVTSVTADVAIWGALAVLTIRWAAHRSYSTAISSYPSITLTRLPIAWSGTATTMNSGMCNREPENSGRNSAGLNSILVITWCFPGAPSGSCSRTVPCICWWWNRSDRYRSEHGQLLEHAPFSERDIRTPEYFNPVNEKDVDVLSRLESGYQTYTYEQHPFDLIGWDGCLYPWAFSIHDFEPITGRIHQPPPVHQTFAAAGFVVCSFVPHLFDYHPDAIPAPYAHSNVDSDEVLFYSAGNFMSRKGIAPESITLHPAGLPHGPQPGKAEASIGVKAAEELAVMIDTFKPLHCTPACETVDDEHYPFSWLEEN